MDMVASKLVDMGIFQLSEDLQQVLVDENFDAILFTSYQLSGILRNVENINISVNKASKVIQALKYYTHFSPIENFDQADINIGIESVLQLFITSLKERLNFR